MIDCRSCGTANDPGARFCSNCGASLVAHVGVQERRMVTALFADLARSTALGEQLDPEVVRGVVGRFFEAARGAIEQRGGTVEKFSGDAVMAVFGLPTAHEDDPERAVRSALAIRDAVSNLNADVRERHGVTIQVHVGIEAGEVVVGDPFGGATMATGDALNVAARLEQLSEPDDVVIGPVVHAAVRELVEAEPLGDVALRGRSVTTAAWRVSSIAEEVGRPRGVTGLEAPLTGRDEEMTLLIDAARRAEQERKTLLFTILGVPGVGKSRLVREATARLTADGWSVVRGRCLPYGDGITYWPVAEMIRSLAGITPDSTLDDTRRMLAEISPDTDVAERLALAIGLATADADLSAIDREISWAMRRLVERVAAGRPMVLIFEDIHWAQPPLLDLIESLAVWTRDTPLLIICPARPELLDVRAGWGSGRMEASRIQLEPLDEGESRQLLASLLTVEDLPPELRQRVLDRAEGNPLFVEEVVRMLIEEGVVERRDGHWYARREAADVRVPDSVEALIRARLDTVPTAERAMLQAASVVGRIFQRSAVEAIVPAGDGDAQIERHLEDAMLRDLISEERAPAEQTFRFRHVLIRDVAYSTLPKARRADLHRAVADWLQAWAGERLDEFTEINAYHLEQAVSLRRQLEGHADPGEVERAVAALAASAGGALARDDARAALLFTERALALEPPAGDQRLDLAWHRIDALNRLGEWRKAGEGAAALEVEAATAGRRDMEGRALLVKALANWITPESSDVRQAVATLERARALLSEAGDDWNLVLVLETLGYEGWWLGKLGLAEERWSEQARVARANGWASREAEALVLLAGVSRLRGDAEDVPRQLLEARALADKGPSRLTRARVERAYGGWLATVGPADEAERILRDAVAAFDEFGDREHVHTVQLYLGEIERQRGRPAEALGHYQLSLEPVRDHIGYLPEVQRRMAEVLLDMGRVEEAAELAEAAQAITGKDDWSTVASTRMVLGLVREAQGEFADGERLLREALELLETTEFPRLEEQLALAEFLLRRGRLEEARQWLAAARAGAAGFGPDSPMVAWVERRGAAAEAMGERGG